MTDYISRADAVKTVIRKCSPICEWQDGTQQYPDCVVAEINALPSADAVPIVYCMDCAKSVPLDEHGALWKCKAHDRTTLRHSYCNNGERKGGGGE